tara:strand:+ start:797 stop:1033 length:237 start_codon:yes stop_codon:yes gene_type:complete
MDRIEKLELLIEIEEEIQRYEQRIESAEWSLNGFSGEHHIRVEENTNDIRTFKMCIDRLNERFSKQLFAIRESQIKNK